MMMMGIRITHSLTIHRSFSILSVVIVVMLLAMSSVVRAAEESSAEIANEVIYLIQGESNYIEGIETDSEIFFLKIVTINLPPNSSRIYFNVPEEATELKVWTYSGDINSSEIGRETAGAHQGQFFINVPPPSERTYSVNSTLDNESELLAYHSSMMNVSYIANSIHLTNNSTSGTYISPVIDFSGSDVAQITSAILQLTGEQLDNVSSEISLNNGTTWQSILPGSKITFTSFAKSLRIRLNFEGNLSQGYDPRVSGLKIISEVVPALFTVHISYLLDLNFADGKVYLDLTELMNFTSDGTLLLLLFLSEGYAPAATGIDLITGTSSMFSNKVFYHNSSDVMGKVIIDLEIISPESDQSSLFILAGALVLAVILILFFRFSRRRQPSKKISEETSAADESVEGDASSRRREMINRKRKLLKESKKLEESLKKGEISEEDFELRSSEIKRELKEIKRELPKLAREIADQSSPATESIGAQMGSEYESALALIAKLDADHDSGRLPDDTYKRLRKSYMEKAAKIKASLESLSQEESMLEQKKKLLDAIASLDEEFERGEIDKKVYDTLRASYRKELVDIMEKSNSIKK